jgi:Capsule polysaccharide biosynthesis protein.
MKKILIFDRSYIVESLKSNNFEIIAVALSIREKKRLLNKGIHVIGCFDEEYKSLPISKVPDNYLDCSWNSDRFLNGKKLGKRKEILGKEISFWSRIFDEYEPEFIVNEPVTIEYMEVAFIEGRKRGIPYLRWGCLTVPTGDIWVDSPYHSRIDNRRWENAVPNHEDFIKTAEYINQIRVKHFRPLYVIKRRLSPIKKLKLLKDDLRDMFIHYKSKIQHNFLYEDYSEFLIQKYKRLIFDIFYKYDELIFDQNNEYFFYPIHYEPESVISYAGFYFDDQAMLIGRIAHSMSTNQILIVKEHPQQCGMLTTYRFRLLKKQYPNLMYIRGNVSAYDIYDHINALITLNGTAGFEAWTCGIPTIVFGEVYYKDFAGITQCTDFKSLKIILREHKYMIPSDENIFLYIAKMFHILRPIFPSYSYINGKDKENIAFLKSEIEKALLEGIDSIK